MADEAEQSLVRRTRYQELTFDGDLLMAVIVEGEGVAVPVRTVCDIFGLDVETQTERLQEHDVLSHGLRYVKVPIGGRVRSVLALLHTHIPYWFATIPARQVEEAFRAKLVRYQEELVLVLSALYGSERAQIQPSDATTSVTTLGQRLTAALAQVQQLRDEIVQTQRSLHAHQESTNTRFDDQQVQLTRIAGLLDEQVRAVRSQTDAIQQQIDQAVPISSAQQSYIRLNIQRIAARYKKRHPDAPKIFDRLFSEFCLDLGTPRYDALPSGKYPDAVAWLERKAAEFLPGDRDALLPRQESLL
jgi:P22_AR N-terminal domain